MALYLGSEKKKVCLNGILYSSRLHETSLLSGTVLKTSNNYMLKDSNESYVTAKEDK